MEIAPFMALISLFLFFANIAIVAIVAYFVIKKAVKDAIHESRNENPPSR